MPPGMSVLCRHSKARPLLTIKVSIPRGGLMSYETLFKELSFRNLKVKNRIFRSNISGRFDNYDGSGNQARINWETKFARRRRSHHKLIRSGQHSRSHHPQLCDDQQRRQNPVLENVGQSSSRTRLQIHTPTQPLRATARHRGCRKRIQTRVKLDR